MDTWKLKQNMFFYLKQQYKNNLRTFKNVIYERKALFFLFIIKHISK